MTTPPQAKNPVCWFELYVDNVERAKRFYEHVFGSNFVNMSAPSMDKSMPPMDLWRFDFFEKTYGSTGALIKMEGMKPGRGGTMVYFSCSNIEKAQEAVEVAGGKIITPRASISQYGFVATVEDIEGNHIGLHEPLAAVSLDYRKRSAEKPPQNPVCWFEICVNDLERAQLFYEKSFGIDLVSESVRYECHDFPVVNYALVFNFCQKNMIGTTGALLKTKDMKPGGGGTLIYFTCDDIDETQRVMVASGGKILKPKWSIGEYGNIAIVEDSEGNCIGLHSD